MSIRSIRRRLVERSRLVAYIVTGLFVIGLPLVFVPGSLEPRRPDEEAARAEVVVARVDDLPVTRGKVELFFRGGLRQMLPFYAQVNQPLGLEGLWRYRLEGLEQAVLNALIMREAETLGIGASRGDVKDAAGSRADQELRQIKEMVAEDRLAPTLARLASEADGRSRRSMSERSFRNWLVKRLLEVSEDELREQIIEERLRESVTADVTATEQELRLSYDSLTLRELVVARTPATGPERTDEEARARAESLLAQARTTEDFTALLSAESDDPQAAADGGLRENLPLGGLPPDWMKALQSLRPGELAGPLETPSGYVIVQLETRERNLPEGFEENKQQHLQTFTVQKRSSAWAEYQGELREKARVEVLDPELLAYQALRDGKSEEVLPHLREAAENTDRMSDLGAAALHYQMATLFASRDEWEEAADAYTAAADAVQRSDVRIPDARAEALVGMANAYERLVNIEEALVWYAAAGDEAVYPGLHRQILSAYRRLGETDLAEQEQVWLDEYQEAEQERQRARAEQQP